MASAITASRVNELAAIGDACRANSPTPDGVAAIAGAAASTSVDNRMEKRVVVFMMIPIKGSGGETSRWLERLDRRYCRPRDLNTPPKRDWIQLFY
jgi:hypothetical protein